MNNDEREKEKERLINEVYGSGKDRTVKVSTPDGKTTLTLGNTSAGKEEKSSTASDILSAASRTTGDLLKQADNAFESLRDILARQQKDLNQMAEDNGYNKEDMERMQREIEKDYGVSSGDMKKAEKGVKEHFDVDQVFRETEEELKNAIVGNDEAIHSVCNAFRRPYLMGEEAGKARNVILITGPKGSGRHACITQMAKSLHAKGVFASEEVYTIDMSQYTSSSQEQIFLQDLYKDLSGDGEILCFENFESGFPAFLRMIDSLVCTGKTTLSRRYVSSKGVLVENQTGLVKNAVDSLSAEGKYLVFITTRGTRAVQDAFGASFLSHVLDVIETRKFTEADAREYTKIKIRELIQKSRENLKIYPESDASFEDWVISHYDKDNGSDAIDSLFHDFYLSLSQEVLSTSIPASTPIVFTVKDDNPAAMIGAKPVRLSREKNSQEEIDAVNKELDEIVGLDPIKNYIRSLQAQIQMNNLRRQQGMKVSEVSKHMIFTGNPGTGKTTIARLISRYMKAIGALSQGQLVEVTRADLVAQYVGQTAPQTMSVIKSAMGGVLFIDEAYSLYRGKDDSFGLECIDTIVKAMEDYRDNLIVILAGYKKEMAVFLEANSGLKSRFPNIIDFPDYTGEELKKIAVIQAKSKGYYIAEEALKPLEEYFDKVQSINPAEAGNGRLARNTIEEAVLKQSQRVVNDKSAKIDELRKEDFNFTVRVKAPEEKKDSISMEDLEKLMNQ